MHSAAAVVTGLTLAVSVLIGILPNAEAKTVRWGADRDIVSLDPYSYGDTFTLAVLNHVYEGLVRYNEQLKIEPALATSWEIVDPATWRFKLRRASSSTTARSSRPTTSSPRWSACPTRPRR